MKNALKFILIIGLISVVYLTSCESRTTPEETVKNFVTYLANGNCKEAIKLTKGEASKIVHDEIIKNCIGFDSQLTLLKSDNTEELATLVYEELRNEKSNETTYTLKRMDGLWVIIHIKGFKTPERVTEDFVKALSSGNCEAALNLCINQAKETVTAQLDAGCEPYNLTISSVNCETNGILANCKCVEDRDGIELTYKYDLKLIDDEWKVELYKKDLNMDDMNFSTE